MLLLVKQLRVGLNNFDLLQQVLQLVPLRVVKMRLIHLEVRIEISGAERRSCIMRCTLYMD